MLILSKNSKSLLLPKSMLFTVLFLTYMLCYFYFKTVSIYDLVLTSVLSIFLIVDNIYDYKTINRFRKNKYTEDKTVQDVNIRKFVSDNDCIIVIKKSFEQDETECKYMILSEDEEELRTLDSEDIKLIYGIDLGDIEDNDNDIETTTFSVTIA